MKLTGSALFFLMTGAIWAACPATPAANATTVATPGWDSSGNCLLNGTYYFRYVHYVLGDSRGDLARAVAIFGNIVFDGKSTYTIQSSAMILDSEASLANPATGLPAAVTVQAAITGSYSISSAGVGYLASPLYPQVPGDAIWVMVDQSANIIGSSSETLNDDYNDLLIASPGGSATNATLVGTYTVNYLNFPGGNPAATNTATFQMNANGANTPGVSGGLQISSLTSYGSNGSLGTSPGGSLSYSFTNGAVAINFPPNPGLPQGPLTASGPYGVIPAQELLYISPDGNLVFGGSQSAWDIFVGTRTGGGGFVFGSAFSGNYAQAGLDEDDSKLASSNGYGSIDSYFGFLEANPVTGAILDHQRILAPLSSPAPLNSPSLPNSPAPSPVGAVCPTGAVCAYNNKFVDTMTSSFPSGSQPPTAYTSPTSGYVYTIGAGGAMRVGIGTGVAQNGVGKGKLGLNVALKAFSPPAVGSAATPYIDPVGIVNAADYAPFTSGVSPGDLIAIFGSNLGAAAIGFGAPGLNGVQVIVNGVSAGILFVSPGQINAIVPNSVSGSYAQIQVLNAAGSSNVVTTFLSLTSPGVLTIPGDPTGSVLAYEVQPSQATPLVNSLITPKNCANPNDVLALYLTGLGGETTVVQNGQLYYGIVPFTATLNGISAKTSTALPLPSLPGMYLMNLVVPAITSVPSGTLATLTLTGPDSVTAEATICINP